MSGKPLKYFRMKTDDQGITVVTFDRPPVNAVSFDVYPELRQVAETIEATDETRVVVLTAPPGARARCGGADVRDFLPLDAKSRMDRYAMINECLPKFYNLNRPVIYAFTMDVSVLLFAMVILGCTGTIFGPLMGAILLVILPEALRFLMVPPRLQGPVRQIVYGLLLVVFMLARPDGLYGILRDVREALRRRDATTRPPGANGDPDRPGLVA